MDHSLSDIMKINKPFGGITVVFGGDPWQILPVVYHGNHCKNVQACIHASALWGQIQNTELNNKYETKTW